MSPRLNPRDAMTLAERVRRTTALDAPLDRTLPPPTGTRVPLSWWARGTARHGTARHGTARHGTARHGTARHGTARHGTARHGTARHGMGASAQPFFPAVRRGAAWA